jgi:hypothetical protein
MYSTIATMTRDYWLLQRLTAAAAQEGKPKPYEGWVEAHKWELASTPGWAEAWESAVAAGLPVPGSGVPSIGDEPGVITDGMILAAVQPMGAQIEGGPVNG